MFEIVNAHEIRTMLNVINLIIFVILLRIINHVESFKLLKMID